MNYAELKTTVADWLARSDLTSVIPTFISLTETELDRILDAPERETFATALTGEDYIQLPLFYELRRLAIDETHELQVITPEQLFVVAPKLPKTGKPKYVVVGSNSLELWPKPDGEYTYSILYKERIPSLSDDNPTNWLLSKHPDVYLYGALTHSAPYLHHDERIGVWSTKYSNIVQQINKATERQQYPTSGWKTYLKNVV